MLKKVLRFLDIQSDLDKTDDIHSTITNGIIFKGTNLWILVFAIIIASVGLNMNSTAVIIGAMLISPLMGPINGIGYSIATYDFPLFRRAIKNFAFAVASSLVASTLYFSITPLSTAHSELLARTSPTIYDVLIALFGGLAGIVAISSRHKGNVIPGVAIATALMPPLCTAGYGLATAQFTYFFGAFYLFTINTVFIAISSILFSQFLNFPIRTIIEPEEKKRVHRWLSFVIIVTIIPSIYFGYLLVQKERFTERANKFIASLGVFEGSYLLKYEVNPGGNFIRLVYGGINLSDQNKNAIKHRAKEYDLATANLLFEQGFSIDPGNDVNEADNILKAEISRLSLELQNSKDEKTRLAAKNQTGKTILQELQTLYPQISSLSYSEATRFTIQSAPDSSAIALVVISVQNPQLKTHEKEKIGAWLRQRLAASDLQVFYQREKDQRPLTSLRKP
jgi:uncharacterized hydrophobic protein (TIGR00271 family)